MDWSVSLQTVSLRLLQVSSPYMRELCKGGQIGGLEVLVSLLFWSLQGLALLPAGPPLIILVAQIATGAK